MNIIKNGSPTKRLLITIFLTYIIQKLYTLYEVSKISSPSSISESSMRSVMRHHNQIFTLNLDNMLQGYPWILSMFSHGTLLHLIVNCIVFASFGLILERHVSNKKFYLLFFISGLMASLVQMMVFSYYNISSIYLLGASGAIAGIIGFMTVVDPDLKIYLLFFIPMKIKYGVLLFISGSLGIIMWYSFAAFNIAHTAHIMGVITGLVFAYFYYTEDEVRKVTKEVLDKYSKTAEICLDKDSNKSEAYLAFLSIVENRLEKDHDSEKIERILKEELNKKDRRGY